MIVKMNVADALDYSSGRILSALDKSKGQKHDAIHLADWPGAAIGLRSAIDRGPEEQSSVLLLKTVSWTERTATNDLACGLASATAVVSVIGKCVAEHRNKSEACDRVVAALTDANTSILDLRAAVK
jgi:hypothetical protein